jgi:fructose-1,6-bisphosphatase I
MGAYATLHDHLAEWTGDDTQRRAIAETVTNIARACVEVARLIALGPLAGDIASKRAGHLDGDTLDGDTQKELDFLGNKIVAAALKASPVAWMGSEENEKAVALNSGAPFAINIAPLDGSSNLDTNVPIGTIFSVLPSKPASPLLQPGRNQLAAGYVIYGPQTGLALTVGEGTHIFWMDPRNGEFALVKANVQIPSATREYGVNSSNFRHWDDSIKAYVLDCTLGKDSPRQDDFNTRWIGSLVADAFRILVRGGIYIYPADGREGCTSGSMRLLYEANPIAMIMEQAGGACTTGTQRLMDIEPLSLHQCVPLIFGSKTEVEEVAHYYRNPHTHGDHSPLFSQRGLFRSVAG